VADRLGSVAPVATASRKANPCMSLLPACPKPRPAHLAATVAALLVAATAATAVTQLGVGWSASADAATLDNGGLEQGTAAPWIRSVSGQTAPSVVTTPVHSGTKALAVRLPVMKAGSHSGACYPTTLSPNSTYTLTAWTRGDVPAQLRFNSVSQPQVAPSGTRWTALKATWKQGSKAGTRVCVVSEAASKVAGRTLYVDDLTLEGGPAPAPTPAPTPTPVPTTGAPTTGGVTKLLTFVEENHSLSQMQSQMPYTNSLAMQYGYATHYTAVTHPSLPNYLAIAGGSTFGVTDDAAPATHPLDSRSVFGQALAAGKTATVYADGMKSNCALTSGGTSYAVKHNPWAYFTPAQERSGCVAHDVPETQLQKDVTNGALPNVGMVVPNTCNDAHNCDLTTADSWFKSRMQTIMAGPDWQSGHLAVVLTADEDDHSSGNTVLTVVIHPSQSHHVVASPLTHYSLTRLYEQVIGTTDYLGNAASAPDMAAAFGLPVGG
jgi:phosphatidylinositol-3-phosphatase